MDLDIPIFQFNTHVLGGTEYQAKTFHERVLPESPNFLNYLCMIFPGKNLSDIHVPTIDKDIIVWAHNLPSQYDPSLTKSYFQSGLIFDKIKYLIVPSEYAKKQTMLESDMPAEKIYVIPNGIDPLKYDPSRFKDVKKVKLAYTSSHTRGMIILLNALTYIKQDFELNIFNDFYPEMYLENPFTTDPRINFYGKTPRKTMYKYLQQSHIFSYPTTFLETFCIAAAESMSAGLLPVYSEMGNLPDVINGYGLKTEGPKEIDGVVNGDEFAQRYSEILSEGIDIILSNKWDPSDQVEYINKTYGWDSVIKKWKEFHETI